MVSLTKLPALDIKLPLFAVTTMRTGESAINFGMPYTPDTAALDTSASFSFSSTIIKFHGWELQADGASRADSIHFSIFSL